MAPSISIFFFFLSLLSTSCLARDSQFFNKLPSTTNTNTNTNNNDKPQQDQPDFIPDKENGYGLYGHESGQFPPSTTTTVDTEQPDRKYLPKNYNPVAYVTEPEDLKDGVSFTAEEKTSYATNPTNYNNGATVGQDFYDPRQEKDESAYRSYPTTTNDNNVYYNGGSSFNSEPQGTRFNGGSSFNSEPQGTRFYGGRSFNSEPQGTRLYGGGSSFNSEPQGTRFNGNENYFNNGFQAEELSGDAGFENRENYFNNGAGGADGFRPQGMSDTRLLANGKYFYNVDSERFSDNHPYEVLRGARPTNAATSFGTNGEFP